MITEIIMLEFDCDECGNAEVFESLEDAKKEGWINVKPDRLGDDWINFCCDECKKEYCEANGQFGVGA